MSIAVTGATGQLGQLIVAKLKKAGVPHIVAVVRNSDKAKALGVTVKQANYDDAAALTDAFHGITTVVLVSGNEFGKRVAQHTNIINAAKAAGVQSLVYTSLLRADTTSMVSLGPEHAATEAVLRASGLTYTILRNGWYIENYTQSLPAAIAHNALIGAAGDANISGATRDDYADAVVAVVTAPQPQQHANQTYELAGDSAFTLTQLAAELSAQTGKTIPYVNLTEAAYTQALTAAGVPSAFAAVLAGFDIDAQKGGLFDEGHTLSKLIGHATTPLKTAVAQALKASRAH